MMNFRGVFTQTIFMGDLCFVAGIGLLISAQWEMVRGNTFSYTVLSAYGSLRAFNPFLGIGLVLISHLFSILLRRLWGDHDSCFGHR